MQKSAINHVKLFFFLISLASSEQKQIICSCSPGAAPKYYRTNPWECYWGTVFFLPSCVMGRAVPFEWPHLPRVDAEDDGFSGRFAGAGKTRARTRQSHAIGTPRFESNIGKGRFFLFLCWNLIFLMEVDINNSTLCELPVLCTPTVSSNTNDSRKSRFGC